MKSNDFFDKNVEMYSSSVLTDYQISFIEFIKKKAKHNQKLIDIGGGSGNFSNAIIKNCSKIDVTILDPSTKLLEHANPNVKKIVGSLPNFNSDIKYDYIHMSSVLHHLIGDSNEKSKNLALESLKTINQLLNDNGFFFLQDLFFESYIYSTISRSIIFQICQFKKNIINIPLKDFIDDLEVFFYTREELTSMLGDAGFHIVKNKYHNYTNNLGKDQDRSLKRKLILLKNWGTVAFLAKKMI